MIQVENELICKICQTKYVIFSFRCNCRFLQPYRSVGLKAANTAVAAAPVPPVVSPASSSPRRSWVKFRIKMSDAQRVLSNGKSSPMKSWNRHCAQRTTATAAAAPTNRADGLHNRHPSRPRPHPAVPAPMNDIRRKNPTTNRLNPARNTHRAEEAVKAIITVKFRPRQAENFGYGGSYEPFDGTLGNGSPVQWIPTGEDSSGKLSTGEGKKGKGMKKRSHQAVSSSMAVDEARLSSSRKAWAAMDDLKLITAVPQLFDFGLVAKYVSFGTKVDRVFLEHRWGELLNDSVVCRDFVEGLDRIPLDTIQRIRKMRFFTEVEEDIIKSVLPGKGKLLGWWWRSFDWLIDWLIDWSFW